MSMLVIIWVWSSLTFTMQIQTIYARVLTHAFNGISAYSVNDFGPVLAVLYHRRNKEISQEIAGGFQFKLN